MQMLRVLVLLFVCCGSVYANSDDEKPTAASASSSSAAARTIELDADPSASVAAVGGFRHTLTACDVGDCVSGGCHFERCTAPVSCSGGLCVFKRCKSATCEGGLCVFDATETPSCPGGGCRFHNVARTLAEGYCTGGACQLEGEPHPTRATEILSS